VPSPSVPAALEVLVVENHADTLQYLRKYLQRLGHTVRTADSMQEALAQLAEAPGDVVISDIGLPDGDGWELLERAHLPETVYALAMSGFGMRRDESRSKAAGFRHHLVKPFTPDDLDEYLAEASRERAVRSAG
jgi:two-component system CheB/CheR fusion protein